MATPLIPWEPANIPEEIQAELDRRKINRNFVFVEGDQGGWDKSTGDWNKYRGPMSPWIRFCSNGRGREFDDKGNKLDKLKEGFIFFGGKDFYSGYGFSANDQSSTDSVIGYLPDGGKHTIDNSLDTSNHPIHVPPPEIEKVSVTIQKELFRRASVEWVCFSKTQLEYMTPYFLVPGITCILEWGWNHFDPSTLLDLKNTSELKRLHNNPYPLYTDHIIRSRGNYDVLFGRITHFEWSVDGNKIRCRTEITSQDRIYAGLVINASVVDKSSDDSEVPFDGLPKFVNDSLTQFKAVSSNTDPETIPQLSEFVRYVKRSRPNNWKEYLYGVFYGRDLEDKKNANKYDDKEHDFDRKSTNKELWINFGLLVDVINYHSAELRGLKGKEIFRVDIDDVVIGGHPNLISCDGSVLLIPNWESPKYFNGLYGKNQPTNDSIFQFGNSFEKSQKEYAVFDNATNPPIPVTKRSLAQKNGLLPDYMVKSICKQRNVAFRDNLDEIINIVRYENENISSRVSFAFPFPVNQSVVDGSKPYPARYSGYLKDLYFNVNMLKSILKNSVVKTYTELIQKILEETSKAAGNFWDFRLVAATGKFNLDKNEAAPMKIIDNRFSSFLNKGTPYTFGYFEADSLLLGMSFKPTLSNAQAIRTIYAQTNNPDKKTVLSNGENELLDYKFRDRLYADEDLKPENPIRRTTSNFRETMRVLQQLVPTPDQYQITTKDRKGNVLVRRLVLPNFDVLATLLDDGDEENNPKYTGIMPGIQASFTIQGIGGLRTFMMFLVRNLPEPYSNKSIVFRIVDVQETIESGKWTTIITAGVIPLRDHIKKRLGITS